MTAAGLSCGSCGTELNETAKFCNECGAAVATATTPAEYKQVTVLFADVAHSMDIAAAVGTERLREIMTDLADRCAAVVQRYGGTVDKFTGDGIMAVFGAPVAMEDHAVRACLAAMAVQEEANRLAAEVLDRDCVELRLRALRARAHGDDAAYAHFRDRYRDMATSLGFEGHIAWAEEMP
jgi:adenylate cyclase